MAKFVYKGEGPRDYLYPNLHVEPGQIIEADENPDPHRFVPANPVKQKSKED